MFTIFFSHNLYAAIKYRVKPILPGNDFATELSLILSVIWLHVVKNQDVKNVCKMNNGKIDFFLMNVRMNFKRRKFLQFNRDAFVRETH